MKRVLKRLVLLPALFAAGLAIITNVIDSRATPNTDSFIPIIYSQAIGATSRNGHYLNGDPADSIKAAAETTYAIPIWGAKQIILVVRDSNLVGSEYVDSMQVAYSLSWDGVAAGTNWTQPRTIKSTSYATNKPSIPDTFMFAVRGVLDTTASITANAVTAGGYVPTYFWEHSDSTTVQTDYLTTYPFMRFIFTPKHRIRGGGTSNAPLIGLRARVHVIRDWVPASFPAEKYK